MSILLVEDEARLRQAIARSLTVRGHQVSEAASHREAVDRALTQPVDLLLLDVNLPDATGWDVLRDLAAAGRSVPCVVFSAVPPSASRIREFRPVGVLQKPFPIEALIRLVAKSESLPRSEGGDRGATDEEREAREEFSR
jgi:DNA-binding response OmpR family regulator